MSLPSVGERLSYEGALCTVRYVGEVAGTGGVWLGVEWDDPSRGKHDGVHKGLRYFTCRRRERAGQAAATPASFIRPTRPADRRRTFLEAVRSKYASEDAASPGTETTTEESGVAVSESAAKAATMESRHQIVISGKVAEEVGFEKVQRQLAQIEMLRVVILDGMCVVTADVPLSSIEKACPSIAELDLSRNLFTRLRTVEEICRQLPELYCLRLTGNRFEANDEERVDGAFKSVRELALDETFLSWPEIGQFALRFPALTTLSAGANDLTLLGPLSSMLSLASTLTSLSLEFNGFTALSDLHGLAGLHALRNLRLKRCAIADVVAPATAGDPGSAAVQPVFSQTLHYVDLSYNRVAAWAFVDALPDVFPGLTSLRIAHNPIYDNPSLDATGPSSARDDGARNGNNGMATTEEAYMITVGRLAGLQSLNFSAISSTDRANAEMFYLSRIAKHMATVPEGSPEEAAIVASHRRFSELCDLYGEPVVVRHTATNPAFLEARLITVVFSLGSRQTGRHTTVQIPKTFDMYAVRRIAGRLFGTTPQQLRLVWETGEWDPVGGFDEEDEDDGDDDEEVGQNEDGSVGSVERDNKAPAHEDGTPQPQKGQAAESSQLFGEHARRWVRREVELKDTPRRFGLCIDGLEAQIRVEMLEA